MRELAAQRVIFVGHSAALSDAELTLLDIVTGVPHAVVCLFEDGPLAAALRERAVPVTLLVAEPAVACVRRHSGIGAVWGALPGTLRLARQLADLVRPGDLLYANSQKAWVVAALAARHARCPVVWHLHDILSADFGHLQVRISVGLANRRAAAVIVNSHATGEAFVAVGGRRGLLHVVHSGVAAESLVAAADARATVRAELGLDGQAFTVGVFGRIAPWKGQHVLLNALVNRPELHALVVGSPLFGEDDYLRELEAHAGHPVLRGRVQFLGRRTDIAALLQAVDVVVHAAILPEPFGRVVVEAMLARRPVVATAAGGVGEIIEHGVDGLLVPLSDPIALGGVLARLAADPALRARLATAGYRKATERFSREHLLAGVRAVLAAVPMQGTARRAARRKREEMPLTPDRVLLISHSAEPSGAELSLADVATGFGDRAAVCLFQTGPLVAMLRARGVPVIVLEGPAHLLQVRARGSLRQVLAAGPAVLQLVRALRRVARGGDVLYANSQKAWIVAALAAWWDSRTVVWHLRDILSAERFGRLQRGLAVFLANRVAAQVLVNSAATGNAFVAAGGRAELLQVVYNGIDDAPFAALRTAPATRLRDELGLGPTLLVGLFGRLAEWKGQHVLLAALHELDGVSAVIVGDALFGEDDYRRKIERLVTNLGLGSRVRLLGHRSDVPELMQAVDIVVHTSIEPEPFGRVIVEGMLAERPVIATAGGGVAEIITHGVDGLIVPPRDAAALAAAIRELASDPERARRIAAAGQRLARERFSLATMQQRIVGALRDLAVTH